MGEVTEVVEKVLDSSSEIKEAPKVFSWSQWLKKVFFIVGGLLSLLSALGVLGGVLFQKGIFGMAGLSNVEINTTLYDLIYYGYYSSMLMFVHAGQKLTAENILDGMLWQSIIMSAFLVFFLCLVMNKQKIRNFFKSNDVPKWKGGRFFKLLLYPLVGMLGLVIPTAFKVAMIVTILLPMAIVGTIGFLGEQSGHRYMTKRMHESLYVSVIRI